jgi:hypothetical protein
MHFKGFNCEAKRRERGVLGAAPLYDAHVRSLTTLCLFGAAAVVALKYPLVGLGIGICCLIGI